MHRFGPLRAEVAFGEGGKFTASIVLLHGLWSSAAIWRSFSGYLSHRGWSCYAVELHRPDVAVEDVQSLITDLRAGLATLEAPPVLVGHDLGAVLAQHCADASRALVSLAPLILPPPAAAAPQVLRDTGGVLARILGRASRAPRGRWKGAYEAGDAEESPALIRRLIEQPFSVPSLPQELPGLVMAGKEDPVTTPASAQALAAAIGAEIEIVPGGHLLPIGTGWEDRVSRLHRWLIKKLGADLLALYEEAIADRDG
jgi:pimeloyl-ACP methyl ester carboxylesterase